MQSGSTLDVMMKRWKQDFIFFLFYFFKSRMKRERERKTQLPVRLKICCGPGQYHGCGAEPRPPWMWPSCHWYSRPRSCLCWQSWRHKICCWGSLRSHLLPGSEGGGAENTQELRAVQFRSNSNHSEHFMRTLRMLTNRRGGGGSCKRAHI